MSRIIKEIEGKKATALFDTGAYHIPYIVALGGRRIEIKEVCVAIGKIEGMVFDTEVVAVDELGKADGYELDAIIGALAMEKWKIRLDSKDKDT